MIRHPKVYQITALIYIDSYDNAQTLCTNVTIPDETMKKLSSSNKYPFYLFYDEDGLELMIKYDSIIEIRRVIPET